MRYRTSDDGSTWSDWYGGTEESVEGFNNEYLYDTDDSGLIAYYPMDEDAVDSIVPDDANLEGYWDFSESSGTGAYLTDKSGNSNDGTPSGTTYTDGVITGGRSFTGSDDISIGNKSIVDNASNLTVGAWVYPTEQTSSTHYRLFSEHTVLYIGQYGTQVSFYMGDGSSWTHSDVSGGTLPINTWSYVTWVKDGTTASIYINGVLSKSGISAPSSLGSSGNTNYISTYDGTNQPWRGNLDEVEIYSRVLDQTEIESRYDEGREIKDYSGNDNHGVSNGTTVVDGKHGNSRYFDGSNDYIDTGDTLIGSGDKTLSLWMKMDSKGTNYSVIFTNTIGLSSNNAGVEISYNTSSGNDYLAFSVGNGTETGNYLSCNGDPLDTSVWYNITLVQDSDSIYGYVNGQEYCFSDTTSGTESTDSNNLLIGTRNFATDYLFNGLVDSFLVYERALTSTEIHNQWLEGSSNPSIVRTESISNSIEGDNALSIESNGSSIDGNTVGYWKLDESSGTGAYIKDSSPNGNDGTPTGTTYVKDGKVGGAREFDGSSYEYITIPNDSSVDIKRTISISLWFKVDSWTGSWTNLINKMDDTGSTASRSYSVFLNSDGYIHLTSADSTGQETINIPTGSILLDQWYYYTAVIDRNNGFMQSYLNGELEASGTVRTTDTVTHSHPLTIGLRTGSSYNAFDGFIDDVDISDIARTSEEIYNSYTLGKDKYISKSIDTKDISNNTTLPFWIASDDIGSNMDLMYGESEYANYEPDENTVGLWHLDSGKEYPRTCSDVLNTGVTDSGVYTIDPDGPGGSAAFDAYCNMTYDGGGWTLLDNFVSSLAGDSDPYGAAIGGSNIQNSSGLTSAGYTTYLTHIEHTSYHREAGYLQMFYSSSPQGYIQKTLPSYADEVYVKWGNWYGGSAYLMMNGSTVQTLGGNYGAATYQASYDTGDVIRFQENGIFWVGEVWVRSSNSDNYGAIEDSSGYSNDGVNQGGDEIEGVIGNAQEFNGTSDYISIPETDTLDPSEITLEAWIKSASFQTGNFIDKGYNSGYRIRTNTSGTITFFDRGATNTITTNSVLPTSQWVYIVATGDSSGLKIYVNGKLDISNSTAYGSPNTSANLHLGMNDYNEYYKGFLDEVRISNIARTPDEIRQAYEVGRRTHPIKVDFKADLESSNLITGDSDKSFTISEQDYGTTDHIENIDVGEKIIVKENVGGIEYIAQGEIDTVNTSTGAVTVSSWDTGSTFPTSGFTINATVFKWHREYIDVRSPLDEDINQVSRLTFRKTTDVPATFWIDDVKKATYMSDGNVGNTEEQVLGFNDDTTNRDSILKMEGDRSLSLSDTEVYSKNTFTSNDISGYDKLPFWIASDQKGYQSSLLLDGSTDYANYIPDSNTVGYWKMDEESGTGAYIEDYSSNSNNGTPTGTIYIRDGRLGGARSFNGSSDYISISPSTTVTGTFTVEAWAKPEGIERNNIFCTRRPTEYSFDMKFKDGNLIHGDIGNGSSWITTAADAEYHYKPGNWYHVAYVVTSTSYTIYVNGEKVGSGTYTSDTPVLIDSNHGINIGRYSGGTEYFNGAIDEVRISNVARSASEIYESYNIGKRMLQPEIKFKADLQSSNLITNSEDTSFDISETAYGTTNHIENLESGDKIIITEDTYKAQGTVDTVNTSTGAVTVSIWDSGSTFPVGGYTTSANVFKWQKEYLYTSQVDEEYLTSLDQITVITSGQANIWYDDVRVGEEFAYIEDAQYLQYQPIFTRWDDNPLLDLYLTEVDITYTAGPTMDQVMRHGKWFDSRGEKQPFWWVGEN
jgi:hypothetical protein